MEVWKDIEGYEGMYQVSNQGLVKSLPREMFNGKVWYTSKERILAQRVAKDGSHYATVSLRKNGKSVTKSIHRLVAEAFIPRIEGKAYVNHKDENKLNNSYTNLEWSTPSENLNYRDNQVRKGDKRSVPVRGFHPNGTAVTIRTAREAREKGYDKARISAVCGKDNRTYKGMKWTKIMD